MFELALQCPRRMDLPDAGQGVQLHRLAGAPRQEHSDPAAEQRRTERPQQAPTQIVYEAVGRGELSAVQHLRHGGGPAQERGEGNQIGESCPVGDGRRPEQRQWQGHAAQRLLGVRPDHRVLGVAGEQLQVGRAKDEAEIQELVVRVAIIDDDGRLGPAEDGQEAPSDRHREV